MFFQRLVTVLLVALLSAVCARPNSLSSTVLLRGPECQDMGMLACFIPMIGFSMIFQQSSGSNATQVMTEGVYSSLCSIAQTTTTCAEGWLNRCLQAEALANVQIIVNGTKRILTMCNEPNSYSQFIKLTSCGEKIKTATETCGDAVRTEIPETESLLAMHTSDSATSLTQMENPQKHICCAVKHLKRCIAPSLETTCTPEETLVTERFEDRILEAFDCTDAIYQTCNQE